MQLVLLRQRRHGGKVDWTAWNQALAGIWLVCVPEVIEAAAKMDRVFWVNGTRIKTGQIGDEDEWAVARDQMESARLEFIDVTRRDIARALVPVTDPPVARPPRSELIRLSQSASDPGTTGEATS
jgi:hypothetical protein